MNNQSKWPVYIAIILPTIFIVGLIGVVFLPQLFTEKPKYDFIYKVSDRNQLNYGYSFSVLNGKIAKQYNPPPAYTAKDLTSEQLAQYEKSAGYIEKLYLYNVTTDISKQISFEEAEQYVVNSDLVSPDGFALEGANGDGGIITGMFGGSRNYNTLYLKKGFYSKEAKLQTSVYYYGNQNVLLGWVIK